ncbi:MAG: phage replication initiation protein, NGO0469 family, partial [Nitrososphaera sp.]
MSLKPDRSESFKPAPDGLHTAICINVIDLGMQTTAWGNKRQVILSFELSSVLMDSGKPYVVSKTFTNSLHEKGSLRAILEPWIGSKELDNPDFSLGELAGRVVMVTIVHR